MTYTLDPIREWESKWELENPEPFPEARHQVPSSLFLVWFTHEMLERVQWHKKRWVAYQLAFPAWRTPYWGVENR